MAVFALCSLAAVAEPPAALPEGTGRDIVARACSQCHSIDTVARARLTRKQWEAQLDAMIAKGAKLSDEEYDVAAAYLAAHFAPSAGS